ncbi:MAG: hypothetical protein KBB54_04555 [Candidatus Pacebacteria bacterium]|nr:hypothetical protein [Candidatus Paceibacterota bacterium]
MNLIEQSPDPFSLFLEKLGKEKSFQTRFGEDITRFGITGIPLLLITNLKRLGLNYSEFHFVCLILARRHTTQLPYFSLNKLTRDYGLSQDTLHRAKERLIKKGYLIISEKRENCNGHGRNYYDISGLLKALNGIAQEKLSEN